MFLQPTQQIQISEFPPKKEPKTIGFPINHGQFRMILGLSTERHCCAAGTGGWAKARRSRYLPIRRVAGALNSLKQKYWKHTKFLPLFFPVLKWFDPLLIGGPRSIDYEVPKWLGFEFWSWTWCLHHSGKIPHQPHRVVYRWGWGPPGKRHRWVALTLHGQLRCDDEWTTAVSSQIFKGGLAANSECRSAKWFSKSFIFVWDHGLLCADFVPHFIETPIAAAFVYWYDRIKEWSDTASAENGVFRVSLLKVVFQNCIGFENLARCLGMLFLTGFKTLPCIRKYTWCRWEISSYSKMWSSLAIKHIKPIKTQLRAGSDSNNSVICHSAKWFSKVFMFFETMPWPAMWGSSFHWNTRLVPANTCVATTFFFSVESWK